MNRTGQVGFVINSSTLIVKGNQNFRINGNIYHEHNIPLDILTDVSSKIIASVKISQSSSITTHHKDIIICVNDAV